MKPDWCPQDVWEATEEMPRRFALDVAAGQLWDIRHVASRAILAERERCAAVADGERVLPLYWDSSTATDDDVAYDMAIDHVIAAIRGTP